MTPTHNPMPGLDAAVISRFSAGWTDDGLWDDITLLARAFWHAEDGNQRRLRWHHLVLAVGNFKRDGGRRLHPDRLTGSTQAAAGPASFPSVPVPGESVVLDCEDAASWAVFMESLRGAGTATTTTLLAALWPTRHFVFDWRVHAVANALRLRSNLPTSVAIDSSSTDGIVETLENYGVVRGWLLAVSTVTVQPLIAIERAMYQLSRAADRSRGAPPRTWSAYAQAVEQLARNA